MRVFILLLILTNPLYSSLDTINTEDIYVTGKRFPHKSSNASQNLEVISNEQIQSSPSSSLHELLDLSAGLDVRTRGVSGVSADLSMRGANYNQVLILVDGIPMTDRQTGHHNMNLSIPKNQIKRIEILKNSGGMSSGVNAFAGVVNIITKDNYDDKISFDISKGDFNYTSSSIAASFSKNKFKSNLSFNLESSDGYSYNTDHEIFNASLSSIYNFGRDKIKLNASYIDRAFGGFNFYTSSYPDQYETTKTVNLSLSSSFGDEFRFTPGVFYRMNYDRFELFRDFKNAADWYSDHNYHITHVLGLNGNLSSNWDFGTSSIGYEFKNERINSTVLGNELSNPIENQFDNIDFTKGAESLNIILFS